MMIANGIDFYDNLKGQWPGDCAAADFSHHSQRCHADWAQKILELIK